jgi:hypothetical protein
VRLPVPELEQQRTLEQEVRPVLGDRQPVQRGAAGRNGSGSG